MKQLGYSCPRSGDAPAAQKRVADCKPATLFCPARRFRLPEMRGQIVDPAYLSGLILVIFEPCSPRPAIRPFWLKQKA